MAAGTSALLILVGGGVTGIVAWAADEPAVVTAGPDGVAVPADPAPQPTVEAPVPHRAPGIVTDIRPAPMGGGLAMGLDPVKAGSTPKTPKDHRTAVSSAPTPQPTTHRADPPPAPAERPAPTAPAGPVITTRTVVETHAIPFRTKLVRDPALPRGTKNVQSEGEAGVRSLRYLITLTDGRRTDRRLLGVSVTKRPAARLVVIGTGREVDPDTDDGGDDEEPWDCGSDQHADLCLPFGRSAALCEESAEPDEGGSGAGMIVLGDSVIDDEDLGLPDGYNWAC